MSQAIALLLTTLHYYVQFTALQYNVLPCYLSQSAAAVNSLLSEPTGAECGAVVCSAVVCSAVQWSVVQCSGV